MVVGTRKQAIQGIELCFGAETPGVERRAQTQISSPFRGDHPRTESTGKKAHSGQRNGAGCISRVCGIGTARILLAHLGHSRFPRPGPQVSLALRPPGTPSRRGERNPATPRRRKAEPGSPATTVSAADRWTDAPDVSILDTPDSTLAGCTQRPPVPAIVPWASEPVSSPAVSPGLVIRH